MKLLKKYHIIVFVLFFITSCGIKKRTTTTNAKMLSSAGKVIAKYKRNTTDIKTFSSKISTDFDNGKIATDGTISLRMERGKIIWLSVSKLGFTIAKAKITPERVQYYEKWQGVYFDGDFSLISKKLGVKLSFEQLENILLGKPIKKLSKRRFSFDVEENSYQFQLKKPKDMLEYIVWIYSDNFKAKRQHMVDKKGKSLTVDYTEYQDINSQSFPRNVLLKAMSSSEKTHIDLTYKSVKINKELRFPFRIPKGYKKLEL